MRCTNTLNSAIQIRQQQQRYKQREEQATNNSHNHGLKHIAAFAPVDRQRQKSQHGRCLRHQNAT